LLSGGGHRLHVEVHRFGGGAHHVGLGRRLGGGGAHLLGHAGQLLGGRRHAGGVLGGGPHRTAQGGEELVEALAHLTDGVVALDRDLPGQVAGGGGVDHVEDLVDVAAQRLGRVPLPLLVQHPVDGRRHHAAHVAEGVEAGGRRVERLGGE